MKRLSRYLIGRSTIRTTTSAEGQSSIANTGNVDRSIFNTGTLHLHLYEQTPLSPKTALPSVCDFVGRIQEAKTLEEALVCNSETAIAIISGMGGAGKTQLARRVIERVKNRFTDGCIVLDMQGTGPNPLTAADAQTRVLKLIMPDRSVPDDTAVLEDRYRATLSGRRLLLSLDNALDLAQVQPLLPPAPVALLITSRRQLSLPGACRIALRGLPEGEAIALLRKVVGDAVADDCLLKQLLEVCSCLPLALRAAGSFLCSHRWRVEDYLAAVRSQRLTTLSRSGEDDAELNVRAVLTVSHRTLVDSEPDLALQFAQLAVFPSTFVTVSAAAVFDVGAEEAQHALDKLVSHSLLEMVSPYRYTMHDLLRDLAGELLPKQAREKPEKRHAMHNLTLLNKCAEMYVKGGEDTDRWLRIFDLEYTNIENALNWLLLNRKYDEEAAAALCFFATIQAGLLNL